MKKKTIVINDEFKVTFSIDPAVLIDIAADEIEKYPDEFPPGTLFEEDDHIINTYLYDISFEVLVLSKDINTLKGIIEQLSSMYQIDPETDGIELIKYTPFEKESLKFEVIDEEVDND